MKTGSTDELGMEAGFMTLMVGAGIALSLGLAFGVLRVAMQAMAAAAAPATTRADLAAAGTPPLR